MTEEDFAPANGAAAADRAKASPLAKKWADNMTAHYDELSRQRRHFRPVAQLHRPGRGRGSLIVQDQLTEKAHYSMSLFLHDDQLATEKFNLPKQVATQASIVQRSRLVDQCLGRSGAARLANRRQDRAHRRRGPGP